MSGEGEVTVDYDLPTHSLGGKAWQSNTAKSIRFFAAQNDLPCNHPSNANEPAPAPGIPLESSDYGQSEQTKLRLRVEFTTITVNVSLLLTMNTRRSVS